MYKYSSVYFAFIVDMFKLFENLQYGNLDVKSSAPETLCQLDIEVSTIK